MAASFARTGFAILMAPFGLIGVVAAMLPTGTPMDFVAQLGVIALAGMIIRNAVILIQEVDENVGRGEYPWNAIIHASTHRARLIVLTALAAMLGMVPIAFQVFWGSMTFAIIGGLAAAGERLLAHARSLLAAADEARVDVRTAAGNGTDHLHIGLCDGVPLSRVARLSDRTFRIPDGR